MAPERKSRNFLAQVPHYLSMPFDFMRAIGVRIVEVDDLGPDARYIPSLHLLLVDAALDDAARTRIDDRVLPIVFDNPRPYPLTSTG